MSSVVQLKAVPSKRQRRGNSAPVRIALLGTGTVGTALVERYLRLRERGVQLPDCAWICNSRTHLPCDRRLDEVMASARSAPPRNGGVPPWAEAESLRPGDIVIDATASETVADWHPEWLLRGINVVTANKLGAGGDIGRARSIRDAQDAGVSYGDSATVGAGLPLLRSIRELIAGGDRVHAVEGILSGSLAWLFSRYDGSQSFSALVREAREAGYTEPDPRQDLSGDDVKRKLLILARAAGLPLDVHQIEGESLLPQELQLASTDAVDGLLSLLDAPLQQRHQAAFAQGQALRFVGRFDADGHASVGLRALPVSHPLCNGQGTDNKVAIFTDRYQQQPLVIQGPGAGAHVTAAALLDDVLRIVAQG